jgi:hypothetical protein
MPDPKEIDAEWNTPIVPYIPKGFRFPTLPKEVRKLIEETMDENTFTVEDGFELIRMRFTGDDIARLQTVGLWPIVPAKSKAEEELNEKEREVNRLVAEFMAGLIDWEGLQRNAWVELGDLESMTKVSVEKLVENKVRDAKLKEGDSKKQSLKEEPEKVNHPAHYNQYEGIEVIDLVEQMNFNRGNAVKYITRAGFKDKSTEIQDLEKALWYTNREVERTEKFDLDTAQPRYTVSFRELCQQMNFNRGNAVLLICRAGGLSNELGLEDLQQASTYLEHEIKWLKKLEEEA